MGIEKKEIVGIVFVKSKKTMKKIGKKCHVVYV
jgi:hypothetical protein